MVQIEVGKNSVPEVGSLPVPPTPEEDGTADPVSTLIRAILRKAGHEEEPLEGMDLRAMSGQELGPAREGARGHGRESGFAVHSPAAGDRGGGVAPPSR